MDDEQSRINDERPSRFIVHISDTHIIDEGELLYGAVDTLGNLGRALAQLEDMDAAPDAILVTGDVADTGSPAAYRRVRGALQTAADRLSAPIVWVMGNHDSRAHFRELLLDEAADGDSAEDDASDDDASLLAPVDRVVWLGGMRLLVLDTTVPGFHHGEIRDEQLAWLADQLREPAPEGTVLAMHHPPMPDPVHALEEIELRGQARLEKVLAGTDVRAILAGHAHYASHTTFAGIPLSVASATCYTNSVTEPAGVTRGVNGGGSIMLVHVYERQLTHTVMPIDTYPTLYETSVQVMRLFNRLTPAEQRRVLALEPDARAALAAQMLSAADAATSTLSDA